jgi:tetratricopeptide (TPR) repeat protein
LKTIILFLLLIIISINISAEQNNLAEYYNKGNEYYTNANFDSALIMYSKLIDKNIKNPALFYNIGNTYYKKNNIGKALLYFYKAHRLNPTDDDIINNINYLNSIIKNKRPYENNFFKYSLNTITIIFISVFILLFLFLTLRIFIFNIIFRYISLYLVILLFILNIASGFWLYKRYSNQIKGKSGVVINTVLNVYSGPADVYDKITEIYEGLDIEIIDERFGFYRIKIFGKEAGWIEKDGIEII